MPERRDAGAPGLRLTTLIFIMKILQRRSQWSASVQQKKVANSHILHSICCSILLKHMEAYSMSVQTPQQYTLNLYTTLYMP